MKIIEKTDYKNAKPTEYKSQYDNSLLVPIPRSLGRNEIKLPKKLPFNGVDFWNCYEVSWLDLKDKPHVTNTIVFSLLHLSSKHKICNTMRANAT